MNDSQSCTPLVFCITFKMFKTPVKRIVTKQDLDEFLNSDAYRTFIDYIIRLNDSVRDLKIDSDVDISPVCAD